MKTVITDVWTLEYYDPREYEVTVQEFGMEFEHFKTASMTYWALVDQGYAVSIYHIQRTEINEVVEPGPRSGNV